MPPVAAFRLRLNRRPESTYARTKTGVEPIVLPRLTVDGTPGRIRTCDLRIRSPLLYPTELQAHKSTGWLTQDTGEVYKKKNERTTLSITVATFEKCYLE